MFNFREEHKKVEDKYGIRVCLLELIEQGFIKLIVYPLVEKEKTKVLLSEEMKNEIKQLLAVEYCKSFMDRILIFFGLKALIQFPIVTFEGTITIDEINQKQNNWDNLCNADHYSRN